MAWPKGKPRKPRADEEEWTVKYTTEQLREIIAAGMSIQEARLLLDDGYAPEAVLELAQFQAATRAAEQVETQAAGAKAMQKAMRPENETAPGISFFSHPEGEQKRPKPPLPYELYWLGYPIHQFPETETWPEWELSAQLKPGTYTIVRKDFSTIKVEVTADRDAEGKIQKLLVTHSNKRAEKDRMPPRWVTMRQMLHQENPQQAFVEAMSEYYAWVLAQKRRFGKTA